MGTESDREKNLIYILKGLAIVCVVCAHSTALSSDAGRGSVIMAQVLDYLGTMGVPVFFLLSGYLFDRNSRGFGLFWKRKLISIVVPWLFCETLLWLYVVLRKGGISFRAWFLFLLGYNHTTYYLTVLMVLFLVFWFLKKDCQIYFICAVSVCSIISTGWETGMACVNNLTGTYYLNPLNWALFFGIGMILNRHTKWCRTLLSVSGRLYIWIPCSAAYFLICHAMNQEIYYFGRWAVIQHLINMLMLTGLAVTLRNRKLFIPFGKLGIYSFPVYLLHQFVSGAIAALTNCFPFALLVLIRPIVIVLIVMAVLEIICRVIAHSNGKLKFMGTLVGIREICYEENKKILC